MKYLSDYIQSGIRDLNERFGVFYAFSTAQFNEQKAANTKYVRYPNGLLIPKGKVDQYFEEFDAAILNGIKEDCSDHTKEQIITRELDNYESWYTGDISDTVKALKDYGYTEEDILAVFNNH